MLDLKLAVANKMARDPDTGHITAGDTEALGEKQVVKGEVAVTHKLTQCFRMCARVFSVSSTLCTQAAPSTGVVHRVTSDTSFKEGYFFGAFSILPDTSFLLWT